MNGTYVKNVNETRNERYVYMKSSIKKPSKKCIKNNYLESALRIM